MDVKERRRAPQDKKNVQIQEKNLLHYHFNTEGTWPLTQHELHQYHRSILLFLRDVLSVPFLQRVVIRDIIDIQVNSINLSSQ